jgi:hypothetical protein
MLRRWQECGVCRTRRNRVLSVLAMASLLAMVFAVAWAAVIVGGPGFAVVGACGGKEDAARRYDECASQCRHTTTEWGRRTLDGTAERVGRGVV